MPTRYNRRQIRYWLFRKQNALEGGAAAKGAPSGLFHRFEQQAAFKLAGGYATFARTWDVAEADPYRIIPRDKSIAEEWNAHLEQSALHLT